MRVTTSKESVSQVVRHRSKQQTGSAGFNMYSSLLYVIWFILFRGEVLISIQDDGSFVLVLIDADADAYTVRQNLF